MSNIIPAPKPFYSSTSHQFLAKIGFELSGISDDAIGVGKSVIGPSGFTTTINNGDNISKILVDHIVDPDLFTLPIRHQEEHSAIPGLGIGLAPTMAQIYFNKSIQQTDADLKWIYMAWALHYLTDIGEPLHTTLDPIKQTIHIAIEDYTDSILPKYADEIKNGVVIKDVTNVYTVGWELATKIAANDQKMYDAWASKNYTEVDRIAVQSLQETAGYVAGVIRNSDIMEVNPMKINSLIPVIVAFVVLIAGIGIVKVAFKPKKVT